MSHFTPVIICQKYEAVPSSAAGGTAITSNKDKQGRKRKVHSHEGEGDYKRKRICSPKPPVPVPGSKRKNLEEDSSPRKRRVCEEEQGCEANTSSPLSGRTTPSERQEFEDKYQEVRLLGAGNFGSVYAGFRREDQLPVAMKHIRKDDVLYTHINKRTIPLEVAIMQKLCKGQTAPASICLLDFYDLKKELILVMERPVPVVDLENYIKVQGGILTEEESRLMMKQLVEAARELQEKAVFHRDIKVENILIDTSSGHPRLRLIDFGLSCFTKKSSLYRVFSGTEDHIPPEFDERGIYRPSPSTVWQIGVVLYDLMHWKIGRFNTPGFLSGEITIREDLPADCQDMLRLCLSKEPHLRPSLEQLSHHPWLA